MSLLLKCALQQRDYMFGHMTTGSYPTFSDRVAYLKSALGLASFATNWLVSVLCVSVPVALMMLCTATLSQY